MPRLRGVYSMILLAEEFVGRQYSSRAVLYKLSWWWIRLVSGVLVQVKVAAIA